MRRSAESGPIESTDAFGAFYGRHAEALVVFFARRVYDPELAMDLTAETFAEALLSRRRFRGGSEREAVGWLYGIARNRLGSFVRKGSAERRAIAKLGVEPPELSQEAHDRVVELADIAECRAALVGALATLSGDQREALDLRVIQELPYEQIAGRLGVSSEVARSRVSRGLARLAGLLDPDSTSDSATEGSCP